MALDNSLGFMASDVDPHESDNWCVQWYSTLLKGFISYTSKKEWEWDIPEVKHVTWIIYE